MIVEVIAVGTELLLGQIVNTNSAHIGSRLADHGLDAHFQQVVGDNLERVATAIRTAVERADAVIITGGIGPTRDDLTREALCAATGRELVHDEAYADRLRRWWEQRGREMPESNLRQAQHPEGAELVINPKGSAPALVLDHEGTLVFCIPGVPQEMVYLLDQVVIPRIVSRSGQSAVVVSRMLRTWGQSESAVGEILDDLYQGTTNPSVAFLASGGEIKVRITAKAATAAEAEALIEPMADEVRRRLDGFYFGADDETIISVLAKLLEDRGWLIGTAESMTGGMVAAALTASPGSSKYMRGGLVAYDPELKGELLGVSDISTVVNAETALEMAVGGRGLLGADVVVAVTGSAGPEPLEKPPGTIFIAVATPEDVKARELRMPGDRERVMTYATTSALHLARLAVSGVWWTQSSVATALVGRVFVAVPPPPDIRVALADRISSMRIPGKVAPPDNWHVTLRFLDIIDQVTYERFLAGMEVLRQEFAFPVALDGFGAFPNPRKATVFWVGLGRGALEMAQLNEVLEEAAQTAGLSPEERPFHPHLTLSRMRPPADVRDLLDEDVTLSWRCDRVVVYRSHQARGGVSYEPLDSLSLIG